MNNGTLSETYLLYYVAMCILNGHRTSLELPHPPTPVQSSKLSESDRDSHNGSHMTGMVTMTILS